jgi:hypothetical protein
MLQERIGKFEKGSREIDQVEAQRDRRVKNKTDSPKN